MELERDMLPEFEGDCDLSQVYDSKGLYNMEFDPFYKYFTQQYQSRNLSIKAPLLTEAVVGKSTDVSDVVLDKQRHKGETLDEYIERRITEPREEYRELGTFYEKPEGSKVLSTKEVAERGVTAEEIDALLVELGYLDEDITPEILYLILYDKEFCEELIDDVIRVEEREEKAFDLEYEEMYDKHVRKLFRFKDMKWFQQLSVYFMWLEGRSVIFAFFKKMILKVYFKYRNNRPVFVLLFLLYVLWFFLMRFL